MVQINLGEESGAVARFRAEVGVTFPMLLDSDKSVAQRYEVRGHPTTFIIAREGKLIGKVVGERNWSAAQSREFIKQLIQE